MNDQALSIASPQPTITAIEPLHPDIIASLVLDGDLAKLNNHERVDYYVHRCRALEIDPGEVPFALIKLDGKLTLYPKKECAQALTRIRRLSVEIRSKHIGEDGLMTVCARAIAPDGSFIDDEGVLDLNGIDVIGGVNQWGKKIAGIGRANAMMKCVTKAKRRAILAMCGLGSTDVDDVPGARLYTMNMDTGEINESADQPREVGAIDVGMVPSERIVMLVSEVAAATGQQKRAVYEHAVLGSGIPHGEYDAFPWRAADLTDEDAAKVAAFLEVHKKSKRSPASEAKPRPRPAPPPEPEYIEEEPPF
jgi:hypothetical protein